MTIGIMTWKLIIKLVFLYSNCNLLSGCSNVVFNQVSVGCANGEESLQMICRIPDQGLGAFIFHNNKEQASCETYPYISCVDFEEQGNITITVSRDIVYTIGSKKKNTLNGTWTCRNGAGERDKNSSFEFYSIKCECSSSLANGTLDFMVIDRTKEGLLFVLLPLCVCSATIIGLRCCNIAGQQRPNQHSAIERLAVNIELLLVKISYIWASCKHEETPRKRSKTEIGCQCFCCFLLFGIYCTSVMAFNYSVIETDSRTGLLVFICLIGIGFAISIPLIWYAGRVPVDDPMQNLQVQYHRGTDTVTIKQEGETPPRAFTSTENAEKGQHSSSNTEAEGLDDDLLLN